MEQVYGAITFYLAHKDEVDANIPEGEAELEHSLPNWSRRALDEKIARCLAQVAGKVYSPDEALQKLADLRKRHLSERPQRRKPASFTKRAYEQE
jgi:ppGpp synthetase/RelA/SpoT-type nucleotidyltranferase